MFEKIIFYYRGHSLTPNILTWDNNIDYYADDGKCIIKYSTPEKELEAIVHFMMELSTSNFISWTGNSVINYFECSFEFIEILTSKSLAHFSSGAIAFYPANKKKFYHHLNYLSKHS